MENCRCGGWAGGGFDPDATGWRGGAGAGAGGAGSMGGGGALSFKVNLSKPNVEYLSVTVCCLCRPAPREDPACVSPCHAGTGAAGAGAGAGVGGAGVVLNTPGGERDDGVRAAGDVLRGNSKTGCSWVGSLKVEGGGPGGGA